MPKVVSGGFPPCVERRQAEGLVSFFQPLTGLREGWMRCFTASMATLQNRQECVC